MRTIDSNRIPRHPTEQAPPRTALLSELPPDLQQAVRDGISKPQDWVPWVVHKGFVVADPGRRLAILRIINDWTQGELASKAGVRQADVSIAEGNIGKSKIEILEKITAALGVTVEEILFRIPKATKEENSHERRPATSK
jgi:DNA-binding Xre family transcriptional regulator